MKYFELDEFNCKCCGVGGEHMSSKLLLMLDDARELAKTPFSITSGYRCEKHNKEVGGKSESAHKDGLAVDIATPDSRTRFAVLNSLMAVGATRIGIANSFIHVDIDKSKVAEVIWTYS